ncbi:hypothetical protein SISSUDRAFT_1038504 [Sistotremastrum suecicum HHB10207 ss-3]|uniref:Uncharacterized protein n=1 Tax=Sistotremastrum suecicum HHB10207 ss-3 TaxID=1314776 RepID=A0A165WMU8_9AGAM|nr:hypothetical protein SISSUDRAFT_1038504 [Sistotremastrum suecicum HHB10207 ss-3]
MNQLEPPFSLVADLIDAFGALDSVLTAAKTRHRELREGVIKIADDFARSGGIKYGSGRRSIVMLMHGLAQEISETPCLQKEIHSLSKPLLNRYVDPPHPPELGEELDWEYLYELAFWFVHQRKSYAILSLLIKPLTLLTDKANEPEFSGLEDYKMSEEDWSEARRILRVLEGFCSCIDNLDDSYPTLAQTVSHIEDLVQLCTRECSSIGPGSRLHDTLTSLLNWVGLLSPRLAAECFTAFYLAVDLLKLRWSDAQRQHARVHLRAAVLSSYQYWLTSRHHRRLRQRSHSLGPRDLTQARRVIRQEVVRYATSREQYHVTSQRALPLLYWKLPILFPLVPTYIARPELAPIVCMHIIIQFPEIWEHKDMFFEESETQQ